MTLYQKKATWLLKLWLYIHVSPHCIQTDVESDQEEDEFELEGEGPSDVEFYEDRRTSEDLEEMSDPHSNKFRAEGQLMNYEEDPSFEGYLQVKVYL